MTRFHAPTIARGWLATALASGADKDLSQLNRTIALEDYPNGLRLVATDRFVLLTAWVPNMDTPNDREPTLDEAPDRTVIVWDPDGRGKSLLGYVLSLWTRMDAVERENAGDTFALDVKFDMRAPAGTEVDGTLEGLEPTYVVLDVPDKERVYLPVVEAAYPDWRMIVDGHAAESTDVVRLHPDRLAVLGKLGKYAGDGPAFIAWTFMGAERAALLDVPESDPHLRGIVMPAKWHTEHDAEPKETSVGDETTPADPDTFPLPGSSGATVTVEGNGPLATALREQLGSTLREGETLIVGAP